MRALVLAAALALTPAAFAQSAAPALIEATSPHPVERTADQLVAAVEKAGARVAARIDHQANARSVGTEIAPATLVVFGNPKVGTPFIAADPRAGLDLPVRVLVFQDGERTRMIATAPEAIVERYGLEGVDPSAMRGAIEKLMGAAAAE